MSVRAWCFLAVACLPLFDASVNMSNASLAESPTAAPTFLTPAPTPAPPPVSWCYAGVKVSLSSVSTVVFDTSEAAFKVCLPRTGPLPWSHVYLYSSWPSPGFWARSFSTCA
jgi:hypothetical protein